MSLENPTFAEVKDAGKKLSLSIAQIAEALEIPNDCLVQSKGPVPLGAKAVSRELVRRAAEPNHSAIDASQLLLATKAATGQIAAAPRPANDLENERYVPRVLPSPHAVESMVVSSEGRPGTPPPRSTLVADTGLHLRESNRANAPSAFDTAMRGQVLADVVRRPIKWLMDGMIPIGKLTVLTGEPGVGKSQFLAHLSRLVTRPNGGTPQDVMLCASEDDAEDTIRPRFEAAGADLERVRVYRPSDFEDSFEVMLEELDLLESVGAVLIDPLVSFLPSGASGTELVLRGCLERLQNVAQEKGLTVVVIVHPNKRQSRAQGSKVAGAMAIMAVARSVVQVEFDEVSGLRRLSQVKGNLARASELWFNVVDRDLESGLHAPALEFVDAPQICGLGDLPSRSAGRISQLEQARQFIREFLADGPRPSTEIQRCARDAGISKTTLDRAREGLVQPKKQSDGSWAVELIC